MKALSLKQPWAELILQGRKTVETRKWKTAFSGQFLIHSSLVPDAKNMALFGFAELPTGCIVGTAEITDVIEYPTMESFNNDEGRHCAHVTAYPKKRYGFVLANVRRIMPIPYKGQLNFFTVPDDIMSRKQAEKGL